MSGGEVAAAEFKFPPREVWAVPQESCFPFGDTHVLIGDGTSYTYSSTHVD